MIIQSTRIQRRSGVGHLARHLLDKSEENERIVILSGDRAALDDAQALAMVKGCRYAVRHLSVSPERAMGKAKLATFLQSVDREFGIGSDRPRMLVMHEKNGRAHFHLAISEVDPTTMRVLDCRNDFARLEALARQYERSHGETVQLTRVERRTAQVEGLSQQARKRAERTQPAFDRTSLKRAWAQSPAVFSTECDRQKLKVGQGEKALVLTTSDGAFVAAAHRAAGARKAEFLNAWKAYQDDRRTSERHHQATEKPDRSAGAAHTNAHSYRSRATAKTASSHALISKSAAAKVSRSGMVKTASDSVDIDRVMAYLDELLGRARDLADSFLSSRPTTRRDRLAAAIEQAKTKSKSDSNDLSADADQPQYRMIVR